MAVMKHYGWGLLAAFSLMAGQGSRNAPPKATSPASGQEMYRSYCASCHGLNGKGNGPVASAMKVPPTDLTTLSRRHGGKFPELRVFQAIEGQAALAAHGTREMPVWGTAFRQMSGSDEARVKLRVRNLTKYIESLQEK